jgi:undecaprenyl-diphosphatase
MTCRKLKRERASARALIGLSRVYLGVHYPSDVLAGFAAATVWVVTVMLADYLHTKRTVHPGATDG